MNKWSYMQKCLYSKQPQSKSKIVTIQAAGKKLQEIPEISRKTSGDFSAGEFFCRKLQVDAGKPVRFFGNHFLRSLAALLVLWMFCFRCSFSCCQTFPGKTISSCSEPMWLAQSSCGNSWAVSIESNGKLSENKVTKYKQVAQQLAETFSHGLPTAWPEQP